MVSVDFQSVEDDIKSTEINDFCFSASSFRIMFWDLDSGNYTGTGNYW